MHVDQAAGVGLPVQPIDKHLPDAHWWNLSAMGEGRRGKRRVSDFHTIWWIDTDWWPREKKVQKTKRQNDLRT